LNTHKKCQLYACRGKVSDNISGIYYGNFGANQGSDKSLQIDDLTPNHDDDT
jgi:hypothetical protein